MMGCVGLSLGEGMVRLHLWMRVGRSFGLSIQCYGE